MNDPTPYLSSLFIEAGRRTITVLPVSEDTEAFGLLESFRDPRIEPNSNDVTNKAAKSVTSVLRLAGVCQLFSMASCVMENTKGGIGVTGGVNGLARPGVEYIRSAKSLYSQPDPSD